MSLIGRDDLDSGATPPPGALPVAEYDPLDAAERQRADELWQRVQPQLPAGTDLGITSFDSDAGRAALAAAGVSLNAIDELADLRTRGPAYVAYLSRP